MMRFDGRDAYNNSGDHRGVSYVALHSFTLLVPKTFAEREPLYFASGLIGTNIAYPSAST
jgi:hypothetical protein